MLHCVVPARLPRTPLRLLQLPLRLPRYALPALRGSPHTFCCLWLRLGYSAVHRLLRFAFIWLVTLHILTLYWLLRGYVCCYVGWLPLPYILVTFLRSVTARFVHGCRGWLPFPVAHTHARTFTPTVRHTRFTHVRYTHAVTAFAALTVICGCCYYLPVYCGSHWLPTVRSAAFYTPFTGCCLYGSALCSTRYICGSAGWFGCVAPFTTHVTCYIRCSFAYGWITHGWLFSSYTYYRVYVTLPPLRFPVVLSPRSAVGCPALVTPRSSRLPLCVHACHVGYTRITPLRSLPAPLRCRVTHSLLPHRLRYVYHAVTGYPFCRLVLRLPVLRSPYAHSCLMPRYVYVPRFCRIPFARFCCAYLLVYCICRAVTDTAACYTFGYACAHRTLRLRCCRLRLRTRFAAVARSAWFTFCRLPHGLLPVPLVGCLHFAVRHTRTYVVYAGWLPRSYARTVYYAYYRTHCRCCGWIWFTPLRTTFFSSRTGLQHTRRLRYDTAFRAHCHITRSLLRIYRSHVAVLLRVYVTGYGSLPRRTLHTVRLCLV